MTYEEIQASLSEMSDDELTAALKAAKDDLEEAATDEPNSEWHQACFAGALTYAMELQKRGLSVETLH